MTLYKGALLAIAVYVGFKLFLKLKEKENVRKRPSRHREILCIHECQRSEGGEAELKDYFKKCTKKAGHSNFVPFNEFNIEHLPEAHRDEDLYSLIKATGDMTVRISVNMVSTQRPKYWLNTRDPYPFGNDKGNTRLRSGTGEITVLKFINGCGFDGFGNNCDVYKDEYERDYKTCPCEKCQHSDKPNNI